MVDDLSSALRTSGYALAHAAWSVESGETLCTLAFVGGQDEERQLVRYEARSIPESVAIASEDLNEQLRGSGHAALVYDGYQTPEGGERTDALLLDIVVAGGARVGRILQAYRAAKRSRLPFVGRARGFEILGRPIVDKSVSVNEDEAVSLIIEGILEHPHGSRLFSLDSPSNPDWR